MKKVIYNSGFNFKVGILMSKVINESVLVLVEDKILSLFAEDILPYSTELEEKLKDEYKRINKVYPKWKTRNEIK